MNKMTGQDNKTLNLYPIDYPFETLVSRIENGKLLLNPDFQRKYKWDKDGNERGSKFIESCLMRIPLPACYFAEDDAGAHLVIDGVQRLTTIQRFFHDDFALEGLTVYRELNGLKFSQLGKHCLELESTTIRCIVLRNDNGKDLIAEIFARLNQGSVILSAQEIRHAIFPGTFDELLTRLAQEPVVRDFKKGPHSRPDLYNSRESEELVLRFFALNSELRGYDENMSKFLDEYMRSHQNISEEEMAECERKFKDALALCKQVFGEKSFRNLAKETARRSASLWDVQMIAMTHVTSKQVAGKEFEIVEAFAELCENPEFSRTLSGRLVYRASILKRREMWMHKFLPIVNR